MREASGDHEESSAAPIAVGLPAGRPIAAGTRAGFARLVPSGGIVAARIAVVARLERLADEARGELDGGLALPALVVVFALGIALYFLLPREPWPPAVFAVAIAAGATLAIRRRSGHVARLSAIVAALTLGVAAASLETLRVAAPRLDHDRTVTVEGRVVDLDATARGGLRLTVDVIRMEGRGLTPETTPARITATLSGRGWRPDVGDGVRFKARLKPPEGPVLPGGYDFARRAWFEGRGAGGYVLGRATPIDLGAPGWRDRILGPIGSLRHIIADRVRASLPGASGAIGAALMVGEQRAIPDDVADALRTSGLTHIVSISGLHMSLVAGGVIVAVRGLLAMFPFLVLGFPIKKWAAAAAFVTATIYLLLSGNQVAALRSHLMLSVALLAVMVDRPAITLHTVAVSAALILAVDPSSALEPSFLMSYLAVIALVAAYDVHRARAKKRPPPAKEEGPIAHVVWSGLRHVEGLALSSLVAGLATAPVIAGVFFRGAPYSILANMVVLPVTGLVIMPAAVVGALAMPFGLDHWPLQVMGLGIDWMILVGRWTAALPAGAGLIGASHPAAMGLGIVAVLWLSAWRGRIRLFGLIPALASLALLFAGPRPDIMIGRHGTPVAVRDVDGRLRVLAGRQDRFDAGIWLAADGDGRLPGDGDLATGWLCDPLGCAFRLASTEAPTRPRAETPSGGGSAAAKGPATANGSAMPAAVTIEADGFFAPFDDLHPPVDPATTHAASPLATSPREDSPRDEADRADDDLVIAVVRHPRAFAEDCRRATLVITTLVAPPGCRDLTTVIDRIDLARGGASTLRFIGPVIDGHDAARPDAVRPDAARHGAPPGRPPTVDPAPGLAENARPGASTNAEPSTSADPFARNTPPPNPDSIAAPPSLPPIDPTSDGAEDPSPDSGYEEASTAGSADAPSLAPRRALRVTYALPRFARPWTPVEPSVERIAREAAEAEAAARTAANTPEIAPRVPPRKERAPAASAGRDTGAAQRASTDAALAAPASTSTTRDVAGPTPPVADARDSDGPGAPEDGEADETASPAADQ